jgi:ATP-dependent DNA ligase
VVLGVDGVADFNALHSGKHDDEVQFCAFEEAFERGEIGPDLFLAACQMGLEGLVSKRRDRPY